MATIALTPNPALAPQTAAQSRIAMLRSLLFDTLVPWAIYTGAIRWLGCTAVHALMLSAAVPLLDAASRLRRREGMSPVAALVGVGIVFSLAAMLLGGSERLLLLRESLVTVVVGLVCLASLPTRRPLMFFFMRYFVAGADPQKQQSFNEGIARPGFRRVVRTVTAVWGGVFLAEFAIRAWLVFHCSVATVLLVSPVLLNGMVGAAIAWNVWYGKRQKARSKAESAS